ncbi:MAG TPA: RNA polymerase factor sigma-54 [Waddliaceae bacterium]
MFFGLTPNPEQNLKQLQRLIMSPQMQQAIHLMQLPIMELAALVEAELELNPVLESQENGMEEEIKEEPQDLESTPEKELEFDDRDFDVLRRLDEDFRDHFSESENYYSKRTADEEKTKSYHEQSIVVKESLFDHLTKQAREAFQTPDELAMAEILVGNLDESGLFQTSLKEIASLNGFDESKLSKVLEQIQQFDPIGVGASSLRESFLIQLRCQGKEDSVAYTIVEKCYEKLLNNRIPSIAKELNCSIDEVRLAINQHLACLDFHPGTSYFQQPTQHLNADVILKQEGEELIVLINDEQFPTLRFNSRYLRMLDDDSLSLETKDFIRGKILSAKWLLKNIEQRNHTLFQIVSFLAKKQREFFLNPEGKLSPLTMKALSQELSLHESTIARAIANKYLESPRGLLPLRYFFSHSYTTANGDNLSSKTVRDYLKKIIDEENKMKPLSDESISRLLNKRGIPCARRTVAKYRAEMKILNAKQRKQY